MRQDNFGAGSTIQAGGMWRGTGFLDRQDTGLSFCIYVGNILRKLPIQCSFVHTISEYSIYTVIYFPSLLELN